MFGVGHAREDGGGVGRLSVVALSMHELTWPEGCTNLNARVFLAMFPASIHSRACWCGVQTTTRYVCVFTPPTVRYLQTSSLRYECTPRAPLQPVPGG
eukprot:888887-Prymnesium_polylepis.1